MKPNCLSEVVFAQLVELIAWGNKIYFWNDAMTFARDLCSWLLKYLTVCWNGDIKPNAHFYSLHVHVQVILYAICKVYGSERLLIVRLIYKEVVYMP